MKRKALSLLLALALCLTLLPMAALADGQADTTEVILEPAEQETIDEKPVLFQAGDSMSMPSESGDGHTSHPVCGAACSHHEPGDEPEHDSADWIGITDLSEISEDGGYYYLLSTITLSGSYEFPSETALCLNSHDIVMDNADNYEKPAI